MWSGLTTITQPSIVSNVQNVPTITHPSIVQNVCNLDVPIEYIENESDALVDIINNISTEPINNSIQSAKIPILRKPSNVVKMSNIVLTPKIPILSKKSKIPILPKIVNTPNIVSTLNISKIKIKPKCQPSIVKQKIKRKISDSDREHIMENFKQLNKPHNRCDEYHHITQFLFEHILSCFPILIASLLGLFDASTYDTYYFGCLVGNIQYGKTIPIQMIIWYQKFIMRRQTLFVTANRKSVRSGYIDDVNSFNQLIESGLQQYLNQHWTTWWVINFDQKYISKDLVLAVLLDHFSLKPIEYQKYKYTDHINGSFPVFIQQPDNLKAMLRFYKKTIGSDSGLSIIIDEVHKMFSAPWKERIINGLTNKRINNNNIMKLFQHKAKNKKLALFGITATPCRVFNDPHINVTHKYVIKSDGHKGYVYHRSIDDSMAKINIISDYEIPTIIKRIGHILDNHKINPLIIKGKIVTPLIVINTERETDDHCAISYACDQAFTNQLIIQEINEKSFNNTTYKTPAEFLDQCNLDKPIVLIGRQCFDMAVKIKPTYHVKESTTHCLYGITDYVYQHANCGESILQHMRPFGYYPEAFKICYHLTKSTQKMIRTALIQNEHIVCQFDPTIGHSSIKQLNYVGDFMHPTPKNLDPYSNQTQTQHSNFSEMSDNDPTIDYQLKGQVNHIQTQCYHLDLSNIRNNFMVKVYLEAIHGNQKLLTERRIQYLQDNYTIYTTLGDLYSHKGGTNNSFKDKFKNYLNRLINDVFNQSRNRVQIAYNTQRDLDINLGVCFPNDNTQWQINASVGPETSVLTHIPITVYPVNYKIREQSCGDNIYHIYQRAYSDPPTKWVVCCRDTQIVIGMKDFELSESFDNEDYIKTILDEITDIQEKTRYNQMRTLLSIDSLKKHIGVSFEITALHLANYRQISSGRKYGHLFANSIGQYANLKEFAKKYSGVNNAILASFFRFTDYSIN